MEEIEFTHFKRKNRSGRNIKYVLSENNCWNCTSHPTLTKFGYPKMTLNNKTKTVYMVVYESLNKPLGQGEVIRHTCDNALCINPEHLISGTQLDNMRDMYERGRNRHNPARGERAGQATLTEAQVIEILNSTEKPKVLRERYNVDRSTIWNILNGKNWNHLDNEITLNKRRWVALTPGNIIQGLKKGKTILYKNKVEIYIDSEEITIKGGGITVANLIKEILFSTRDFSIKYSKTKTQTGFNIGVNVDRAKFDLQTIIPY